MPVGVAGWSLFVSIINNRLRMSTSVLLQKPVIGKLIDKISR